MNRFYTLLLLLAVSLQSWAFIVGNLSYTITVPSINGEEGEVTVIGLSPRGLSRTDVDIVINKTVSSDDRTYKITAIADSAFKDCKNIKSINCVRATDLTTYGRYMAAGCTNLSTVSLAGGSVDRWAFANCPNLSRALLGDVTYIWDCAFENCTSLTQIVIPVATLYVHGTFVNGCSSLTTITVYPDNAKYQTYAGCLYSKGGYQLVRIPPGYALEEPFFHPNVNTVCGNAVNGCVNVKRLNFPYGMRFFEDYACANATSLEWVKFPSTMESLATHDFDKCEKLGEIYVNAPTPPRVNPNSFSRLRTTILLHVPYGKEDVYKTSSWSGFNYAGNNAGFGYDYTDDDNIDYSITQGVVYRKGQIYNGVAHVVRGANHKAVAGEITLPDYITVNGHEYVVERIAERAFYSDNEFSIKGGNNIVEVGGYAFFNSHVTSIELHNVKVVYFDAFSYARHLTELVLPNKELLWKDRFFAVNGEGFTCYIHYSLLPKALSGLRFTYADDETCDQHIAPCFTATSTTLNLAQLVPLKIVSPTRAFIVPRVNDDGLLQTYEMLSHVAGENTGVILANLTPGKFYKIPRRYGSVTPRPNMLKANERQDSINLSNYPNAYYWDTEACKFVRARSQYMLEPGLCYLVAPDQPDEIYLDVMPPATNKKGDVNGDGTVDVTDVNLTINVMLGKATKSEYPASDVNGDGTVDVTDVNLIINVMLGK